MAGVPNGTQIRSVIHCRTLRETYAGLYRRLWGSQPIADVSLKLIGAIKRNHPIETKISLFRPHMKEVLEAQYKMIQSSRSVLLDYCDTVTAEHFVSENNGFGRGGSIRNLLVHNGTTYQYWIGKHALGREMVFPSYDSMGTVQECRRFYAVIDDLMTEFLVHFNGSYVTPVSSERNGKTTTATPLEVFTHVCTHEFHHKGQILSISRQQGYIPVDTDIIR